MVQYSCCQCAWLNSLLCSQYWQELLKHSLRNQTLFCWAPNVQFEALKVLKLSHFACNWFIVPEAFLVKPPGTQLINFLVSRVPAESRELPNSGKYSELCPVLERRSFSQTRNTFAFWVEGNFLSLNIHVHSLVAQIFLENISVLSKSSSHLPPTFLSLLATVLKYGMWKLTYSNLVVLSIRVIHPWIQCHQEERVLHKKQKWAAWEAGGLGKSGP